MKLVSIIIPVYNRAQLIGETLDSILNQTYNNWECIVVDDGSTDETKMIVQEYVQMNSRIKLYNRPGNCLKGANACRNYGFENSIGDYVKWFDSDDIMLPMHLEALISVLKVENVDFVVGDSVNFENGRETNSKPYDFDRHIAEINPFLYATNQIGWITDDFLAKREVVQKIKFNEKLEAGQEYNYFIRLLHYPLNGVFINLILSHRRIHSQSITSKKEEDTLKYFSITTSIKYHTANDLVIYNNKALIRWFLSGYMRMSLDLALAKLALPYKKEAFKLICKYYSVRQGSAFLIALFLGSHFKKGYNIMKYARK
jgi:glycosyltransferase involved in cell wall biosynthesis